MNKNINFLSKFLFYNFIFNISMIVLIMLLFFNSKNVILEGNYQINVICIAHSLLMVFFVILFIFNEFGNNFLPWMNNIVNFLLFLAKKIKLSFYPLIGFFIITFLLSGNFSYASGNDDLPLPNNGNSSGLVLFIFFILLSFIGKKHNSNIDNMELSDSSSNNSIDIKEIEEINKVIIDTNLINEIENIPDINLSDKILSDKLIGFGVLIFGFFVMCFVISECLHPNYTKSKKKLKKK